MKKRTTLLFCALIACFASLAQNQGGTWNGNMMVSPEERANEVMIRFAPLNLSADKSASVKNVFMDYFQKQKQMRDEMRGDQERDKDRTDGGAATAPTQAQVNNYNAMRTRIAKLDDDRDAALKNILSKKEYRKYKNTIEPDLKPKQEHREGEGQRGGMHRRGGGMGGGYGGRGGY